MRPCVQAQSDCGSRRFFVLKGTHGDAHNNKKKERNEICRRRRFLISSSFCSRASALNRVRSKGKKSRDPPNVEDVFGGCGQHKKRRKK
jgi:hypothetical protein